MRIAVIGGTRFIGRVAVDELLTGGHDVLVVHRGNSEPPDLPDVPHLHADLRGLAETDAAARLAAFEPDAVLHCMAIGAADTADVLAAFPDPDLRLVVLSSCDTYRAYGSLHAGIITDAVPLDETSPVREERYPYRGQVPGMDDYDKLDVEEPWLARGGVVLRLPMVTGPFDYQRRQEFVLSRIRYGRERMPIGAGNALLTHGDVYDVGRGIRLALEATDAAVRGEIFNFGEERTPPMALRARQVIDAAGSDLELVHVPDEAVPEELGITRAIGQHLLVSSVKAESVLGWTRSDPEVSLRRTVEWHLERAPELPDGRDEPDWTADDAALAAAE